jgi:hypothetical protein
MSILNNNIYTTIYDYFDFYIDTSIENKTALCIIPKISHVLNINIAEMIDNRTNKEQDKLDVFIICDLSSSMKCKITDNPLQNITYNGRTLNIPKKIANSRLAIEYATIALISHILQNELLKTNINTNLHIIPFSENTHECVSFINIEDIQMYPDIDYTIFDYLTKNFKSSIGTNIHHAFKHVNNMMNNINPEDKKIVIVLTDGIFNDNLKAIYEYEQLNKNLNISIGCISMGNNTDINMIKKFNIGGYLYIGDFISKNKNNCIFDIIPCILYNLLYKVFDNTPNTDIANISLNIKNKYDLIPEIHDVGCKYRDYNVCDCGDDYDCDYDDFELVKFDNFEVKIWNLKKNNVTKINRKLPIKIKYPLNNIEKSYIYNCITPIYTIINQHDINQEINIKINDNIYIELNLEKIHNDNKFIELLEINDNLNIISDIFENNIFKDILNFNKLIKCYNNNDANIKKFHEKKIKELKKLNDIFLNNLNLINKYNFNLSKIITKSQHELNLKSYTIDKLHIIKQKIFDKKLEMFNERNNNIIYSETSIRQMSKYKSMIYLKIDENTDKSINDNINSELCKICLHNKSIVCNINCGHITTCDYLECKKYVENINKCIICRLPISNISGTCIINIDKYEYNCIVCQNKGEIQCSKYLFDCGHVGLCDNCTNQKKSIFFDCHRCKKKVKILCSIFL